MEIIYYFQLLKKILILHLVSLLCRWPPEFDGSIIRS